MILVSNGTFSCSGSPEELISDFNIIGKKLSSLFPDEKLIDFAKSVGLLYDCLCDNDSED